MAKELAIVLSSGTINSVVTAALAAQKYRLVLVHVETAQTPGRSAQAFDMQVQHFKPYRSHRLSVPLLSQDRETNRGTNADPRASVGVTARLVELLPVIAIGARLAKHYNANPLYVGLRVGAESADLPRVMEHAQIWGELLNLTCEHRDFDVQLPILELEPWQVVDLGVQVSAPLQMTWTCQSLVGDPCGRCPRCTEREAAFTRAGRHDPLLPVRKAG